MVVLDEIAKKNGLNTSNNETPEAKLRSLIDGLAHKEKVIILIDEYDKPIIDHITNPEIAEKNRDVLKSFYDVIKAQNKNLRAIFITGVSKFAKTSIFSGINNLNDISEKSEASSLLGYTQQELEHYLMPYIIDMAKTLNKSKQAILDEMKEWYNGYRFSEDEIRVYNPFSILYYLKDKKRANYWISSGNPTFLIRLLQRDPDVVIEFDDEIVINANIQAIDIKTIPLVPLLYQTGYLTIRDAFHEDGRLTYRLDFPNREIHEAFAEYILVALAHTNSETLTGVMRRIKQALADNDLEKFCLQLRIMLAHIPYQLHI